MTIKTTTIKSPDGLHARPAGDLAKLAKSFPGTRVILSNGVREVNASSILSILSLGLKKGTLVEVKADGPVGEKAVESVIEFLDNMEG